MTPDQRKECLEDLEERTRTLQLIAEVRTALYELSPADSLCEAGQILTNEWRRQVMNELDQAEELLFLEVRKLRELLCFDGVPEP